MRDTITETHLERSFCNSITFTRFKFGREANTAVDALAKMGADEDGDVLGWSLL